MSAKPRHCPQPEGRRESCWLFDIVATTPLRLQDIDDIVDTYQFRKEKERYSKRVSMEEIEGNDYNLNISRYVSTAILEEAIDLDAVNQELRALEDRIVTAKEKHNKFLEELALPPLP